MRQEITEIVEIPEGMTCQVTDNTFVCKKDSAELSKSLDLLRVSVKQEGNKLIFHTPKGTKRELKQIRTCKALIKNMFSGLENIYVYKLEKANVHFPMTLKVEGDKLVINNFLGEKTPRYAKILPNVKVEIKGENITVSAHDKYAAGQTAGNFEKATFVRGRDRRVFQDGIYITEKAVQEVSE